MASIHALLRERAGYVARNLPDRVAQVDAQLVLLGYVVPVVETAQADSQPETAAAPPVRRGRPPKNSQVS